MRLLFLAILLSACFSTAPELQTQSGSVIAEPERTVEEVRELETFPSEISIPYFAKMRLEGTEFTLVDVLARNDAYTRYTITYKSNGLLITGILNLPHGDGPFPLFILNHGYIDPAVYTNGRGLKREQDYLTRQGFAVLHSDYRGHAGSDPSPLPDDTAIYDAGLEYSMDVVNGIRAIAASDLPIDTHHISMLGHSMGGGVTMNIAVAYPDLLDAVVLYAPVHTDAWENFVRWRSNRKEGELTVETLGTRDSDPTMWDAISSLAYLDALKAPVLLFQGTNDSDVPSEWSDFLAQKLSDLGKDVTYVLYDGEKHEFITQWTDFMRKTATFAKQHIVEMNTDIYDATRITKKPFGLYVQPGHSPVDPERFAGYHSGVDFEVHEGETASDIVVSALCDGTVVYTNWVKGYGGVLVQSCMLDGEAVTVLYGHLAFDSIPHSRGDDVYRSEFIGTLGKPYSTETDNERAHLHLAVHRGTGTELRGYAQEKEELHDWLDPVDAFSL